MIAALVVAGVVVVALVVAVLVFRPGHHEDGRLCQCTDCREARARQAWVRRTLAESARQGDVEDARESGRWREL